MIEQNTAVLVIRADASPSIGTGHVMRCMALAQAWVRTGGKVIFLQAESTPSLARRLAADCFESHALACSRGSVEDAAETIRCASAVRAGWVVADGYCFGPRWQRAIRAAGYRLLVVDDYGHHESYDADLILNQNVGALAAQYPRCAPDTRLLLGSRYAMLRREFLAHREKTDDGSPSGRRILVTLGGADPENVTMQVVRALAAVPDVEIVAVAGGSNPNRSMLEAVAETDPRVRLVVDAQNMPELMAGADLAVAAGGSTAWELAFIGVPAILLILADNQIPGAWEIDRQRAGVCLGKASGLEMHRVGKVAEELLADPMRRADMRRCARRLVDGFGVGRVMARLRAPMTEIRRATRADCERLWNWANDPSVRAAAFNSGSIDRHTHARWFERKMSNPNTSIYISVGAAGNVCGQVRFDCDDTGRAEIDVSVDDRFRGAGLGSALIRRATDEYLAARPGASVIACVKEGNTASVRAFLNADYESRGVDSHHGHEVVKLEARN